MLGGIVFLAAALSSISACQKDPKSTSTLNIIGGELARPAPYMASLHKGVVDRKVVCGGVLIAEDVVLTAAQCVTDFNIKAVSIGDNNESHHISVKAIIVHPDFIPGKKFLKNDVALIKLNKAEYPASFQPQFINIADTTNIESYAKTFHVFGRGTQSTYGWVTDDSLRELEVPLVSKDHCRSSYQNMFADRKIISDSHICAGNWYKDGSDSCRGDTGGPLIYLGTVKPLLVGVLSFADACGQKGLPAIYTRADTYYEWISEASLKLSKDEYGFSHDELAFMLKRNCPIQVETTSYKELNSGFINSLNIFDIRKSTINEIPSAQFIPGKILNSCRFTVSGNIQAVFEYKEENSDVVHGVLTVPGRKWRITPRKTQKKQLSCSKEFKKIDVEWFEGEDISKVYTDEGEFYAHPIPANYAQTDFECEVGGVKLVLLSDNQYKSEKKFMRVSGQGAPSGTYLIEKDVKDSLKASIEKTSQGLKLKIVNDFNQDVLGLKIECNFSFKLHSTFQTFDSNETSPGFYNVFFDKSYPRLWRVKKGTTATYTITSEYLPAAPSCTLNNRTVEFVAP